MSDIFSLRLKMVFVSWLSRVIANVSDWVCDNVLTEPLFIFVRFM